MNKKNYQKPEMKEVLLQHQTHLLSGSDQSTVGAQRNGYSKGGVETWE